ncbi:MAG: conjugal transfer protein TraX [Lachnospiraceae bacterium]|jgi:hypothetical protein|nr:conjugal transfer protein TraX [Lachnospiraceae bacterium]
MTIPPKKPFYGSTLKWIAIGTMFIDHIGACLLEVFVMNVYGNSPLAGQIDNLMFWYEIDRGLRLVGRIAFPIFCFLLVVGALHTRNLNKYMGRLAVFAFISEIPFDLAFHNQLFYWGSQNVYFTLLIGLGAIWILKNEKHKSLWGMIGLVFLVLGAQYCKTDYGAVGVLVIIFMYVFRDYPWLRCLASVGTLVGLSTLEIPAVLAFGGIALYNGERGRQPRYFFYAFYPIHLLLLWIIGQFVLIRVL